MLIVFIAALLGIWRYRSSEYFRWVGAALVWMLASSFLFQGGGSLEDPSGDGWITHQVRVATDDGPLVALFGIAFLILYYGGLLFFVTRMRKAAKLHSRTDDVAFDDNVIVPDRTGRKVLETAGLVAAVGGFLWFSYVLPVQQADAATVGESDTRASVIDGQNSLTVEQELLGVAAEMNATLPQSLDQITTLERVTASARTLTYRYQIEAKAEDRTRLEKYIRTTVIPKVCTGPQRADLRTDGVSYVYSYTSRDFAAPLKVQVDEALCSSLEG